MKANIDRNVVNYEPNKGLWGDQGDGTYNNPILPADYSDPDIIRVDNDYFLITSTFQLSPGLTVLHSLDLVNWTIIGVAVKDLTQISPRFNWDKMDGYSRGIWAPCLTYRRDNKTFYIHFGTPDEGFFMVKTQDVFGEWSKVYEVVRPDGVVFKAGWDDCGVLWDDDGQGYFIGTNFADNYQGWLYKLADNAYELEDFGVKVHCSNDHYRSEEKSPEAYKIFKKDGWYYFYHNGCEGDRKAWLLRSKNIYATHSDGSAGTFENPGIYEHISYPIVEGFREPNQGNLIDAITSEGVKWYFYTHHGTTRIDGRPNSLIPVEWKDGWPVVINDKENTTGQMIWNGIPKPFPKSETKKPQSSDDFDNNNLGSQWTWNFQPRMDKWSLQERPGFMRLYAFRPLKENQIETAGNTLLQRMYKGNNNMAETKIDISCMVDGHHAGLLHMAGRKYSAIGISNTEGKNCLQYLTNDVCIDGDEIPNGTQYIWFKAQWGLQCINTFYYSFDGTVYTQFGEDYQLLGSDYRGDYIGIYNYNNLEESGYIDVDFLKYEI